MEKAARHRGVGGAACGWPAAEACWGSGGVRLGLEMTRSSRGARLLQDAARSRANKYLRQVAGFNTPPRAPRGRNIVTDFAYHVSPYLILSKF